MVYIGGNRLLHPLTVSAELQIKNVAAASNAALQHDVAFLQKETQNMQSKLERSLQGFETVQQEAQAVEGEIVDEVRSLALIPCAALQSLLCCCSIFRLRPGQQLVSSCCENLWGDALHAEQICAVSGSSGP